MGRQTGWTEKEGGSAAAAAVALCVATLQARYEKQYIISIWNYWYGVLLTWYIVNLRIVLIRIISLLCRSFVTAELVSFQDEESARTLGVLDVDEQKGLM